MNLSETWEEWECGLRYVHALCVCTRGGVHSLLWSEWVHGCVCMHLGGRGRGRMHICV